MICTVSCGSSFVCTAHFTCGWSVLPAFTIS
jgi:hypothetical protein